MASGSSATGSGSKGFDFGSDDILCSHDDFRNQEASNGNHTDHLIGSNSGKAFHESRTGRSALLQVYNQPEESLNQDMISTVENTMKKYADNILCFLEGISGRLSQLELYCYNLERSIGEMRSDLIQDHGEADSKLRSLEKHLQEVHMSVQIMRDKQELAETHKKLAKIQLVQKESSTLSHSQHREEGVAPSASDPKIPDNTSELQNQQLALALPHQVVPPTSLPARPMEQHQPLALPSQTPPWNYPPQNQLPSLLSQTRPLPQDQYLQADPQYQRPQMQIHRQAPQSHASQTMQAHPFPSYQQQWPQQIQQQQQQSPQAPIRPQIPPSYPPTQAANSSPEKPQQIQQPQQPSPQAPIRPQTPPIYPPYPPTQAANSSPETFSASMRMQVPFSGNPQSGVSQPEPVSYGYGGTTRATVQQQQPPQHNMQRQLLPQTHQSTRGAPSGDRVYPGAGPYLPQAPRQGYVMYDGEGGRVPHSAPPHFPQGGYHPTHVSSLQNLQLTTGSSLPAHHPSTSQMMRSHPYGELIEKAVNMGYGRDHVASVIHRMEESGQPVDFNAVLEGLNVHSGGSQRGWSG